MSSPTDSRSPITAGMSDAQLMLQSQREGGCFGVVFDRHVDAIFGYIAARVGSTAAEDIVADTFEVAFNRRAKFDLTASSARPWLYGIATRRLMKHRDAERRWLQRAARSPHESGFDGSLNDSDARLDARRMAPELAAALLRLSAAERDVLLLHAFDELSHEQVASVLGISVAAARTRLSRGRARMRTFLMASEPCEMEGDIDE